MQKRLWTARGVKHGCLLLHVVRVLKHLGFLETDVVGIASRFIKASHDCWLAIVSREILVLLSCELNELLVI